LPFIDQLLDVVPDWLVIAGYTGVTVAIGLAVARIAQPLYQRRGSAEGHALADSVYGFVLYFAMFVIAFAIGDARVSLGSASDMVEQEAFQVMRLDRQLLRYGAEPTEQIRVDLDSYVHSVLDHGWKVMAVDRGATALTRQIVDRLTDEIYALAPQTETQVALKPPLIDSIDNLDKQRELRLEAANRSIPGAFWTMTFIFVAIVMVSCGRYQPTTANRLFIGGLMMALGVSMAFLAILDVPFRGQTSVSRTPLIRAAAQIETHLASYGAPAGTQATPAVPGSSSP
jgi:Protein of unknown function (DUF4239)